MGLYNKLSKLFHGQKDLDEVYLQSFQRIVEYEDEGKDFFRVFYHQFMMSSPLIQEKFRDTDMKRQISLLKNFLTHLQAYYQTGEANEYLRKLAHIHGKTGHNITAEMYGLWKEAFFKTLKQCDEKWTPRVQEAWDRVLTPGIEYMISQYDE